MTSLVLPSVVFLAFVNGANDNFKGVATIYGSGVASYRTALFWATVTTLAGALLAPTIASGLIGVFQAKGLLPNSVISSPIFMASAVMSAALAVGLATMAGLPVSTTHALTGGLVGAGLVTASNALDVKVLVKSFAMPLLLGPCIALALGAILGILELLARRRIPISASDCACFVSDAPVAVTSPGASIARTSIAQLAVVTGSSEQCDLRFGDRGGRVTAGGMIDFIHIVSAGAVGFARGINDAPKIVALGLAAGILGGGSMAPVALVSVAMALGGVVGARKVARTMSSRISSIEPHTGMLANSASAILVIVGSLYKLPLSTTHVTTGTIVGVSAVRRRVDWKVFGQIAMAWVTTLPIAIALGAGIYLIMLHGVP